MKIRNHAGFSVVELLIVVAVIAVLGFAGYSVYHRHNTKTANNSTNGTAQTDSTAKATDVASSPKINSTSDLDKAAATLDQTDPDGSNGTDTSQLDAQLADF